MKKRFIISVIINSIFASFLSNCWLIIATKPSTLCIIVPLFLVVNIISGFLTLKTESFKNKVCCHGTVLLFSFYISVIVSAIYHILLLTGVLDTSILGYSLSAIYCICINAVVFWNGIICVYLTSSQLGIKIRVIGIICGMIPVANLIALYFIIKATAKECIFETEKEILNKSRQDERICATKYPILLVHGVFFRDSKYLNYWGRIPKELEDNGARIFYGNHQSAASIEDSAQELANRINEIIKITGEDKVNIIAHSKGGLDCRYALLNPETAAHIASLTTINTPHRGCLFADALLNKFPEKTKNKVASAYNATLKKFGDKSPDFLTAVSSLTNEHCQQLNSQLTTTNGVFCQSVGSILKKATGGKFPLNFSYHLVKYFDGKNDGLVSENSFKWGENYILLTPKHNRGISHGDMIDLNRENIDGFDVREFYVNLVYDLKKRGF
ncbi:MAG: alpha/beta fold hydrolase [Ruminococcaceae bacterium]|nr:alpha/beta fold hydrolase [Oscillospiraceae bacterium]